MPLSWSLSVNSTQTYQLLNQNPNLSDFSGTKRGVLFRTRRIAVCNGEKSFERMFVEIIIFKSSPNNWSSWSIYFIIKSLLHFCLAKLWTPHSTTIPIRGLILCSLSSKFKVVGPSWHIPKSHWPALETTYNQISFVILTVEWEVKHSPALWIFCDDPANFKGSFFILNILRVCSIMKIEPFKPSNCY